MLEYKLMSQLKLAAGSSDRISSAHSATHTTEFQAFRKTGRLKTGKVLPREEAKAEFDTFWKGSAGKLVQLKTALLKFKTAKSEESKLPSVQSLAEEILPQFLIEFLLMIIEDHIVT